MTTRPGRTREPPSVPRVPLVSVLVPAYNHERYIAAALDSIRDDGYPNLEIVVIDDGSTDETWDRVVAWERANRDAVAIRTTRQSNVGLAMTLNRLLEQASGSYATTLASDDRLLPGGIEARVGALEDRPISRPFLPMRA